MRPKDTSLHEAFFPCPVEFGCAYDELVYRRRLHDHPIEIDPQILAGWLTRYVEARTWTIPDHNGSTRADVEIAIPSLIGTEFCTQPHIAKLLSISAKTLQRHLARDGISFAALLDKTRERMARRLLAESEIPVASIAGLLGYAKTPPSRRPCGAGPALRPAPSAMLRGRARIGRRLRFRDGSRAAAIAARGHARPSAHGQRHRGGRGEIQHGADDRDGRARVGKQLAGHLTARRVENVFVGHPSRARSRCSFRGCTPIGAR